MNLVFPKTLNVCPVCMNHRKEKQGARSKSSSRRKNEAIKQLLLISELTAESLERFLLTHCVRFAA